MNITDDIKRQILQRTDIVEIIGEAIDLKQRGKNFLGLCPFHNDSHPSLNVSRELGIYKCFACGAGGDAITFLMDYHRLDFIEAMKVLAQRAGIVIPDESRPEKDKAQSSKYELAINVLAAASEFYKRMLDTPIGSTARSLFTKRGFTEELVKEFSLGYSPDSWDATLTELKKQGFTESALDDAGLIVRNETNNSYYDRFRNRAMFPIHDYLGKIIAFGARQLDINDKLGKYINSPQTIVYDKGRTLYGLFQAKNDIRSRKSAILVEGYADVISMHQAGFKNTIASSGTALTKEQLDLLNRYCKKIYIAYDGDSAGMEAAERALELALEKGFEVLIVRLPDGEDPDSIVQKHGGKMFNTYLDHAVSFLEYKIDLLKSSGSLSTPAGKSEAVHSIVRIISKIPDRFQHDDYIRHLSSLVEISENQLKQIYQEKKSNENSDGKKQAGKTEIKPTNIQDEREKKVADKNNHDENIIKYAEIINEEKELIRAALANKNVHELLKNKFEYVEEKFISSDGKRLLSMIMSQEGDFVINDLLHNEDISESDKQYLTQITMSEEQPSSNWERFRNNLPENDIIRFIKDIIYRLEEININIELDSIQNLDKTAPDEQQLALAKKINECNEKLIKLKKFYEIE
jgi:DNA primase